MNAITCAVNHLVANPALAWTLQSADIDGVLSLVSTVVTTLGSILMLWGAVGIGLSIKDGQGMSMDTNVGKLVGGAFIVAAAVGFTMISTS